MTTMRRNWVMGVATMLVLAAGPAGAQSTADLFSGFQGESKDPIQVDAQVLEIAEEGNQRVSMFSGNVVVRRAKTTLTADAIKLYSGANVDLAKEGAFDRIEASGGVTVSSGPQTVTGSTAVVNMQDHTITVAGNVVLKQGPNVITGSRLVVNLATGRARVEQEAGKQIRGVFTPESR